ncbi:MULTISPECIES: hypothetical protein [Brevibacterium]|uniref:Uncharacterized protein n=3 Tax=Bacteria TaxID=2 RepID=K9AGB5_9MICO|nr:hypothetical protein [Brevibacterium casei]NJE66570.1 hypothetical protein [Brevibacterium sp. LS14]EKU46324.1 hypothetical protein C272_12276 [Brevibacterium casei S18]KZE23020.1 hypothetical protein AVW13_06550 [Brevibacterium casei]MBE4695631.1 hypothetical protein [Brevibacterium casei]MBY3578753.1 hypothetical protein [Brevibacterium casei]
MIRGGNPSRRARTGLAGLCALLFVAVAAAVALSASPATQARFTSEAADSSGLTVRAQPTVIRAKTLGVETPDYGDWNWFDRQMNETSLTLTNDSSTTLVATIRIASVQLTGENVSEATDTAQAWVRDAAGAKQQIAASVTSSTSTAQFPGATLQWKLAPGAREEVEVGVGAKPTYLLYQDLTEARGAKFSFRFAVEWAVDGLTEEESAQLYPDGVLGPAPGDRSACPAGATAKQECRGVTATVKQPVIKTEATPYEIITCTPVYNSDSSHTFSVRTVQRPEFSGLAKTARRLDGDPEDYASYVAIPEVGSGFTGDRVEVIRQPYDRTVGYDRTVRFVIRGTGGAAGHPAGPNGERETQSPVYEMNIYRPAFDSSPSCTVSLATL